MKIVVKDCKSLDKRARDLGLETLILMENAGSNLARLIFKVAHKLGFKKSLNLKSSRLEISRKKGLFKKAFKRGNDETAPRILFVLGAGNNAADCLVAARILSEKISEISLFSVNSMLQAQLKKSTLFEKQEQILLNLGFEFLEQKPNFKDFDIIVEGIFGSGLTRALSVEISNLIKEINLSKAFKIACDVPCGLGFEPCFKADLTATMGAFKEMLFEDFAKESVGKIKRLNLGLKSENYAPLKSTLNSLNNGEQTNLNQSFLLEKSDLKLIERAKASNKGDFGHGFIAASSSAGSIAALAALNFGAGLVSLLAKKAFSPLIMLKEKITPNATAAALGMGLKDLSILKDSTLNQIPLVLDANCFLSKDLTSFLKRSDVVLTPHPKEFTRLFELVFNESLSVSELQKRRFFYARKLCEVFKGVLVLKGANTLICQEGAIYICDLGTPALAKAGSGDALAGMILALLCARFSALEAARNAVLAHALVARKYKFNANSFDALKLIKGLKCL